MKIKLRPHQREDYEELQKRFKKTNHLILGAATGYGKSIIIYKFVKDQLKKGGRVVIIAPRRKLVFQLVDTLAEFTPSIIMGSDTIYHPDSDVFICSTPTLASRLKKHGIKYLGNISAVVVDEVHQNFGSASMAKVSELYWDDAKWLGLSATPIDAMGYRLEGYDYTIYNHQTNDLIQMGWLKKIKVLVEEEPEGLDQVGMVGGDYNESQLGEFMSDEARVSNVYEVWKKYAQDRKVMIFCVNIAHAEVILEDFQKHKVAVGVVHSKLGESTCEHTLNLFEHGDIDVLINVSQLTTGFDMSSVDAAIIARPSKSLRLWLQIVGRILRKHKGIKTALLLDVAGTIKQHGYPTMRRDFNKIKPPQGASDPIEFKDIECPFCGYSTQPKNCRREQIVKKHVTINRVYCPNCEEIIDETTKDTKKIKKMQLLKDPSKLKDHKVGQFIEEIRKEMEYKSGWTNFVAQKYNKNEGFKNDIKMIYARHLNEKANLTTCGNNIRKLMNG